MPIPVTDPARYTTPGAFCGDWPMFREPAAPPLPERGQEGVHIIDISDPTEPRRDRVRRHPVRVAHRDARARPRQQPAARLHQRVGEHDFGSPTPGEEPLNCRGIDIIEVPLDNPAAASYLNFLPSGDPAEPVEEHHRLPRQRRDPRRRHEGRLLGRRQPDHLHPRPGRRRLARGADVHAPHRVRGRDDRPHGGLHLGRQVRRSSGTSPAAAARRSARRRAASVKRTLFFVDVETGEMAGTFVHPAAADDLENCTGTTYNVVPPRTRPVRRLRARLRQLPVGYLRRRLHGPGERGGDRLR